MGKILSREAILACSKLASEVVHVPEWGGDVIVQELTGRDRDVFEAACVEVGADGQARPKLEGIRARLAVMSVVDEEGQRLFSHDDVEQLAQLSGAGLDRIFGVAQRLSRLSTSDLEELEGNSGAAPGGDSGSV